MLREVDNWLFAQKSVSKKHFIKDRVAFLLPMQTVGKTVSQAGS
jgi:hypothetical protein